MKRTFIGFIYLFITLSCPAQTFSSIVPDSVYARFFLFDKKVNRLGVFCKDIYDKNEFNPAAKKRDNDPISENYERFRKMLTPEDYEFFQQQIKACKASDFSRFYGKSNYVFKRKRNSFFSKKTENRLSNIWYSIPLFNVRKDIAVVYWERIGLACTEVFVYKNGVWESEFGFSCVIE